MNNYPDNSPPHNIDAEQSVLGSIIIDKEAYYKVIEHLGPDDFYRESHRLIFSAIIQQMDENKPVDLVTLTERLRQNGDLEKAGGAAYVSLLINMVPTAANAERYAEIVAGKSLLRRLIQAGHQIMLESYEDEAVPDDILDLAEKKIMDISMERQTQEYLRLSEILPDVLGRIEERSRQKGNITGVATGFFDLDKMSSGLQKGDLIILAARPSMGKTALALNIAQYAAVRNNVTTLFFSLEMSKEQLTNRLLSVESMVNQQNIRTGNLSDDDVFKLSEAASILSSSPLFVDDSPGLSVREMRSKARRLKMQHDLGLIVIDYLQLMQSSGRQENRQQEISAISRSLKAMAKELNVPVLALSQLSRAVEQRGGDKRPVMSDLRESGSLEQDADVVMFIYRPEYYDKDGKRDIPDDNPGNTELLLAKQRNGPTGKIWLGFLPEYTRFVNVASNESGVF